jgi:hypothetical protein
VDGNPRPFLILALSKTIGPKNNTGRDRQVRPGKDCLLGLGAARISGTLKIIPNSSGAFP